jgi:phenylalanyl-tRNA synthetase beta chain
MVRPWLPPASARAAPHNLPIPIRCTPQNERPVDAFDAKADALAILQTLGLSKEPDITTNVPSWYHPGRSGALTLGGKIILGFFGELHPAIVEQFDMDGRVCGFELFLDAIPAPRAKTKSRPALKTSEYQAAERDFAFIVDDAVTAAQIIQSINKAEKQLITDVRIFDVYSGKGVDAGKKSVAVKVTLQAFDRTLSDADITTVSNNIVAAADKGFGGRLRT